MSRKGAFIYFNSLQATLSVVSDKGGFGCLEYSARNNYSGVSKSFFVSPNEIEGLIVDLCNRYCSYSGKKLSEINLILPQHFFRYQPTVRTCSIQNKVTEQDIKSLRKQYCEPPQGYVEIEETEGGFALDGKGDFTKNVIGKEGTSCQLLTVLTCLNSKVTELFNNISKNTRIDFEFIAPCDHAVKKLHSDGCNRGLLLKINQLTSDLVYFEGDLPISSLTVSYGSYHFVETLSSKCGLSFDEAAEIVSHVNLALALNSGNYVLSMPGKVKKHSVGAINTALIELVEKWSKEVYSAVKGLIDGNVLPIYVIGSSVAKIHGFNEIISHETGLPVYLPGADFSYWTQPEDYVLCALFENY